MYPCGQICKDVEQGTLEWKQLRLGKVTASRIADLMAKVKSGEAASVKNYRAQLVCERLTGTAEETCTNGAMQRGIELEPIARECYEFLKGVTVEQVAFVDHPTILFSGASPDGMLNDNGLIEIKCPNTATHIEYLLSGIPPANYVKQMLWQMACTGAVYCDFISYDPRLPEELQLFIYRLNRDDAAISEMEQAVIAFNASVDEMVERLKERAEQI